MVKPWHVLEVSRFDGGLDEELTPFELAGNQAQMLRNVEFSKVGALTVRKPRSKKNDTALAGSKAFDGIFRLNAADGTRKFLTVYDTDVYELNAADPEEFEYVNLYKEGTVSVTNGSATVTGSGTRFKQSVVINDLFGITGSTVPGGPWYTIQSVDSNTQLTLTANYAESTQAGITYAIRKVLTAGKNAFFAQRKNNAYLAHGPDKPTTYDGTTYRDLGFATPTALSAAEGAAGALPAGTFKYKVVYVGAAGFGLSNPSSSTSITITASKKVDLTGIPLGHPE